MNIKKIGLFLFFTQNCFGASAHALIDSGKKVDNVLATLGRIKQLLAASPGEQKFFEQAVAGPTEVYARALFDIEQKVIEHCTKVAPAKEKLGESAQRTQSLSSGVFPGFEGGSDHEDNA